MNIVERCMFATGMVAVLLLSAFLVFMEALDTVTQICEKRGQFEHHGTFYECKRITKG